jgi:hypothetical protein
VSTDGQTLENQRPELDQLARARNLPIVATYAKNASAAQRRPEFDRMMADAGRGAFSVLLVWSLDRFGRSMAGNVSDALALDRARVELMATGEPADTLLRLETVMLEPHPGGPHDDHIHVRTACSAEEEAAWCETGGPVRQWLAVREARGMGRRVMRSLSPFLFRPRRQASSSASSG